MFKICRFSLFFNEQFFPYNFEVIEKYVNFRDHCHVKNISHIRGSFFMFVESGCIATNIDFTVP